MKLKYFTFLFCFLFLFSCDDALECLLGLEPEINESAIARARVDEFYFQRITAEVNNDPADNNYFYYFDVVGELPIGVDVIFFDREIHFRGYPEEIGNFNFTVFLSVDGIDPDGFIDPNPTCGDTVSRNFTLTVLE